ncbi:MAG TPA: arabinofuranosidase catalytic domain-containing protein [Polyangia bacterium]
MYAADGGPCVAAHSTVRVLLSTYSGPIYQVRKGGAASGSGGTTQDIGAIAGGFADGAAQDTFCGTSACTISKIYDQSGKGNHLTVAPAGGAKRDADNESDAKARPITISGHKVYGEDGKIGVGYRNNKPSGTATGDNAETEYAIFDAKVFNGGCCYDYGNMETNSMDNGEGTMDAIYWGNCTIWGRGAGSGPWVMGDLENGLWAGNVSPYSGNTSVTGQNFVTAVLKSDKAGANHWSIKAGDPQGAATLSKKFDGVRPNARYNPMRKEGAIGLNTGGDNSNGAIGVFFEGAMTAHYSSDAADDAVQANIVSAGYGK